MKILHVACFGKHGKLNGIYEAVFNLAFAQKNAGNDVKIAITAMQTVVDDKFIFYVPTARKFKQLIKASQPDIVVFHSMYDIQQISFSHVLRKKQIPYVLVFHGGASRDNARKGYLKKKIANLLLWDWFIFKAKMVFYLNNNEYKKSIFKKINSNYRIIPNGVNYPSDAPMYHGEKMNVTFMSRIDYYGKGLDVLLPAIQRLLDEGWKDKIHFIFYGFCIDESYKLLTQFGDFTEYKGYVVGKDKAKAFIEASLNILPSRSEGMPMTILEALSYGRPCLVTPMTNMAELIEENECGWVTDLSVDSMVASIKQAYQDFCVNPNMYYQNCRNVAQDYSWEKIAGETIQIYKQVLG